MAQNGCTEAAVCDRHERRPFTFAGLWENWKDPESGEWVRTCTIITGEPSELIAQIHPRMPVILPEQHHAAWLGETDDGNLKALLAPYPADQMRMWEISPRVNSPKNDDPSLWEPLHAEPAQTTTDALVSARESITSWALAKNERLATLSAKLQKRAERKR